MSRSSASRRSRSPMTSSKRRACSSSSRLRAARSCSSFSSGLDAWASTRRARSESGGSSAFGSSLSRPRRGMSMPTQFRTSGRPCGCRRTLPAAVDVGTARRHAASSPDQAALLPWARTRVKKRCARADTGEMDTQGARQLAARLRAGVWMGMRVELVEAGDDSRLSAGDRGLVEAISDTGLVVVSWDRGFTLEVDPVRTPLRRLAA